MSLFFSIGAAVSTVHKEKILFDDEESILDVTGARGLRYRLRTDC